MRSAFLGLALLESAVALGQGTTDHVVTAKRAMILGEARIAVGQLVYSYSTSPSGRYLVAVREVPSPVPVDFLRRFVPPPLGKQIVVWDSQTGQTKEIALPENALVQYTRVEWFAGADKAFVNLALRSGEESVIDGATTKRILWVGPYSYQGHLLDPARGTLQSVQVLNREVPGKWQITVSPTSPVAVKATTVFGQRGTGSLVLQALTPDGKWGPEVKLPPEYHGIEQVSWSADGSVFQALIVTGRNPSSYERKVVAFAPLLGTYEIVNPPVPQFSPPVTETDVALSREVTALQEAAGPRSVLTWWLKSTTPSEQTTVLVSEHATHALLPTGEKFVAYVVNGTVFTRQILEMDLRQFREVRMAEVKALAMSDAKQAALAALMYSADYNNTLPPGLDPMKDLLPYARNSSVLERFQVAFGGGSMLEVGDPANTVLGYIQTDYGRAVAYIDGHVKWENKG